MVGEAENRNAPNGTAALSFVENSEAARYVFVMVVVVGDVMIAGRRYRTFVLACAAGRPDFLVLAAGACQYLEQRNNNGVGGFIASNSSSSSQRTEVALGTFKGPVQVC